MSRQDRQQPPLPSADNDIIAFPAVSALPANSTSGAYTTADYGESAGDDSADDESANADDNDEDDRLWTLETATPMYRSVRRNRNVGRSSGMARSLASAMDKASPFRNCLKLLHHCRLMTPCISGVPVCRAMACVHAF